MRKKNNVMEERSTFNVPTVWGGIECTINRIGNHYKDQLKYSGHYKRSGDIEAIAKLGICKIRYPVLWEKHQPFRDKKIDWKWTDQQMNAIRVSGMMPIAGLLHHGSGPAYTNLLDPGFPALLASYAYEVASRYPWIDDYTPVNEPLTTSRFSGLYGLWFPHHKSELSFYRMLLNQLKATVLSMEAIHSINPAARLIQTEDLGKTYSTPLLSYQAEFENARRLLTFDILTGRLQPGHCQYNYILDCGIQEEEISFFQTHRAKPDVLGLNYYVTSERWLDESLETYSEETHGGNGIHKYADTELVRAGIEIQAGFSYLATEIWERYQIPLAVTESHLHCTREEQLRWFKGIWDQAVHLTEQGIEIKGVTAWALLGSFDWDTLLTKTGTQYESGVFDIKTFPGQLRPTALAALLKTLTSKENNFHAVLSGSGWWCAHYKNLKSNTRPFIILETVNRASKEEMDAVELSSALSAACDQRRIPYRVIKYKDVEAIRQLNPWAVINTGAERWDINTWELKDRFQYITFHQKESNKSCLRIIAEQMPMNFHQVNKVLDLVIDGDTGCWIFGLDQMFFKSEIIRRVHQIA